MTTTEKIQQAAGGINAALFGNRFRPHLLGRRTGIGFSSNLGMGGVLLALGMLLSGCGKQATDEAATEIPQPLTINFDTRTAEESSAFWQDNDEVKIVTNEANEATNEKIYRYTAANTPKWAPTDGAPLATLMPATVKACFPATATSDKDRESFELPRDQSSADKLHAADYQTAIPTTVTADQPTVDLTLQHRLCRITVNIGSYANEFGNTLPSLSSFNIYSAGSSVSAPATDPSDFTSNLATSYQIMPFETTDANGSGLHRYEAIVTPGNYNNNRLIFLAANGFPMYVNYTGTLEAGKSYTFTLRVGQDVAKIDNNVTITDWATETHTINSDLTIRKGCIITRAGLVVQPGRWNEAKANQTATGIILHVSGGYAHVASIDSPVQQGSWCESAKAGTNISSLVDKATAGEAATDFSGEENTNVLVTECTEGAAVEVRKAGSSWSLPAAGELMAYFSEEVQTSLILTGNSRTTEALWSSTECNNSQAWMYKEGELTATDKTADAKAIKVTRIALSELNYY